MSTGTHQERTQKAARRKRGQVKTFASDGLQPLVARAERHEGIRRLPGSVETHREKQQRLTAAQEEALSWVGRDWESLKEIEDRTGVRQMVVRGRLRVLAQKELIERCHETGRVRRSPSANPGAA